MAILQNICVGDNDNGEDMEHDDRQNRQENELKINDGNHANNMTRNMMINFF